MGQFGFKSRKARELTGGNATTTADETQVSGATSNATEGFRRGGPIRGPGSGTSDSIPKDVPPGSYIMPADSTAHLGQDALSSLGAGAGAEGFRAGRSPTVPVNLSNGEYELPPEQVHAIGVQALDQMKDVTHTPAGNQAGKGGPQFFFADGGQVPGKSDGDWQTFDDGTGSLHIPRAEMPQIRAELRGALVNFLNARGIEHGEETLPAFALMPTQAEYSPQRLQKARDFKGGDRAILVSQDGHVLDGHHQWLAALERDGDVRVLRFDQPMRELLGVAQKFPSATLETSSGDPATAGATGQRFADGGMVNDEQRRPNSFGDAAAAANDPTVTQVATSGASTQSTLNPAASAASNRVLGSTNTPPAAGSGLTVIGALAPSPVTTSSTASAATGFGSGIDGPARASDAARPTGFHDAPQPWSGDVSHSPAAAGFHPDAQPTKPAIFRSGNSFGDSAAAVGFGARQSAGVNQQNMDAADALAARSGQRPESAAGFGFRRRQFADGGLVPADDELLAKRAAKPSGDMIGRGSTIHMGMAEEVPRTALPPPSNVPANTGVGTEIKPRTQIAEIPQGTGRNPPKFMGMADVVPQERLAAPPVAPAAAMGARGAMARAAGPAGAALGAAMEGQQVLDVARDPNSTGIDVAAQAARGVGRLASAGAGAAGGAAVGAMAGPLAPVTVPVGAVAGGALGYFAADKAIQGGGMLADAAMRVPAPEPSALHAGAGAGYPESGGAAFGVFPQMPRGGTDARVTPVQAQVSAIDNNSANSAAISAASTQTPPPAASPTVEPPPFGGGPVADPNGKVGLVGAAGVTSADRIAQEARSAAHARDMSDRALELARQGATGPTPGMTVIDGVQADARQRFFDEAALRTAASRGSWSPRKGYATDSAAIDAAALPARQRAEAANVQAREQGASQRTALQLAFENARERRAAQQQATATDLVRQRLVQQDQQFQQSNAVDRARLNIEAGKAAATINKDAIQQGKDSQDIFSILEQAQPLLATATNSTVGNAVDKAAQFFGGSTQGAESAAQLKALQGALVAKMPKMSGPQSDKDVLLYREMAGQIGDPTIPRQQRQAAMETIRELNVKYLPAPSGQEAFNALPSGAVFRAPDGSIRRKP